MTLAFSMQTILNTLPGAIGFKDNQSRYRLVNQQLANYMGYQTCDEVVGLKDAAILHQMSELADSFVAQEQQVLQLGAQQHIDIGRYAQGELQIHLSTKKAWYNAEGEIIGTVFHCIELQNSLAKRLYELLAYNGKPALYHINGLASEHDLTEREAACLFFLLRGHTAKSMATRLSISAKTIEYYLEQLKVKLKCHSRQALIERALHLGFMFILPSSLL
jgi:DNA-binding CsgD family transcriptional regulator